MALADRAQNQAWTHRATWCCSGGAPTPTASAVFYPNTTLGSQMEQILSGELPGAVSCFDEVAGCRMARTAQCTPECDPFAGQFCMFDATCTPQCVQVATCTVSCGPSEYCRTENGVSSCIPVETFDAGTLSIIGGPLELVLTPDTYYTYAGGPGSAPFTPGGVHVAQASGALAAGLGAFSAEFVASPMVETTLATVGLGDVFGTGDVPVGWVPGNGTMRLTGTVQSGTSVRTFECPASDELGSAIVPRALITTATAGAELESLTVSLSRTSSTITKGIPTVGALSFETLEPEAWVEVVTSSTESHTFVGCADDETLCDGACVSTSYNPDHCGACGRTCAADYRCENSNCVFDCPLGTTACSGTCTDTDYDNFNCGGCNRSCYSGEICMYGVCMLDSY